MKHASHSPISFLPETMFRKFPALNGNYKLVTPFRLYGDESLSLEKIEEAIAAMKDLLIHAVIRSQENNWMVITQVEAYYHDQKLDGVSQNGLSYTYPSKLGVTIEKCEMGRATWYEARFRFKKLEFIATGGITNGTNGGINAFLGVTVPSALVKTPTFFGLLLPARQALVVMLECSEITRGTQVCESGASSQTFFSQKASLLPIS